MKMDDKIYLTRERRSLNWKVELGTYLPSYYIRDRSYFLRRLAKSDVLCPKELEYGIGGLVHRTTLTQWSELRKGGNM